MNHKSYNKSQLQAIAHGNGPALVLAGPGSGKTAVITQRIHHLIHYCHVRPEHILVITFTRSAAQEMKNRYLNLSREDGITQFGVNFGTFHSIFWKILSAEKNLSADAILKTWEQKNIIRRILSKENILMEKENKALSDEEIQGVLDLLGRYCVLKEESRKILEKENPEIRYLSQCYRDEKKKQKKVDYEDMSTGCAALFQENDEILNHWQEQFRYILVDEFQDINHSQYEVLKLLASGNPSNHTGFRNIVVVGDDDQSIYGFRGANPGFMRRFMEDFPEAATYRLDVNYRSGEAIVDLSGVLIGNNKNRMGNVIRSGRETKGRVECFVSKTENEEKSHIMKKLEEYRNRAIPWNHIAILSRKNSDCDRLFGELSRQGIPCSRGESRNNWKAHKITKDMIAYIRLAAGPMRRQDFIRIMNRPLRFLEREGLDREILDFQYLKELYGSSSYDPGSVVEIEKLEKHMKTLKWLTPDLAVSYVRKIIGYDEVQGDAYIWKKLDDSFTGCRTLKEWLDKMEESEDAVRGRKNCGDGEGIVLTTYHGSKGLEYDYVILPRLNEGVVPAGNAESEEELEEERRMLYVAITRAREELVLMSTEETGGRTRRPSRFLWEMGLAVDRSK